MIFCSEQINGGIKVFAVTHIYQNQKSFAKFFEIRSLQPRCARQNRFAESSLRSQIFFAVAHMCARCVGKFLHWSTNVCFSWFFLYKVVHSNPPSLKGKLKKNALFSIFLMFFTFARRTKKITFFFVKKFDEKMHKKLLFALSRN